MDGSDQVEYSSGRVIFDRNREVATIRNVWSSLEFRWIWLRSPQKTANNGFSSSRSGSSILRHQTTTWTNLVNFLSLETSYRPNCLSNHMIFKSNDVGSGELGGFDQVVESPSFRWPKEVDYEFWIHYQHRIDLLRNLDLLLWVFSLIGFY